MTQRLEFTYRGRIDETQTGLVRYVDRCSLLRGWSQRVLAEPRSSPWVVMGLSYVMGAVALLPSGLPLLASAVLLHAVWLPLLWLFWRLTYNLPRLDKARLRRLRNFLERARQSLPGDTSIDVHAHLAPDGCRGRQGRCGMPWMEGYFFLKDGSTIEWRVTDGKACPLVRANVMPGHMLLELEMISDDTNALGAMPRHLGRQEDHPGIRTRLVEPDGPFRLRWVLEQSFEEAGDEPPVWPLMRLSSLAQKSPASPAALPEPDPALALALARDIEQPRPAALSAALVPQSTRLVLRQQGHQEHLLDPSIERRWSHMWEGAPAPTTTLMSMGVVVNAILGIGALALATQLQTTVMATGAVAVGSSMMAAWGLVLALGAVVGLAHLVPIPMNAWRLRQVVQPPVGVLDVADSGIKLLQPAHSTAHRPEPWQLVADIDFERPFSAHLTRQRTTNHTAETRVFMTLTQRDTSGTLRRAGVSALLSTTDQLKILTCKDEVGLPELSEDDFVWLWQSLRRVASAHGAPLPALGASPKSGPEWRARPSSL